MSSELLYSTLTIELCRFSTYSH